MSETKLKIKNDQPDGKSVRVQYWNGKVPTYDSEGQRAKALFAATGVDAQGNALNQDNPDLQVGTASGSPLPNEEAQAQANTAASGDKAPEAFTKKKLKKDELIALLEERKAAGFDVTHDEADTVEVLREKISGTYAAEEAADAGDATTKALKDPVNASASASFEFSAGALLQEQTLTAGEEKVLTITDGCFITIKTE